MSFYDSALLAAKSTLLQYIHSMCVLLISLILALTNWYHVPFVLESRLVSNRIESNKKSEESLVNRLDLLAAKSTLLQYVIYIACIFS